LPRSAGFDAENRLYLFALTVPFKVVGVTLIDVESVKALFEPEKPCKQEHR
jgi:hypothetical protein